MKKTSYLHLQGLIKGVSIAVPLGGGNRHVSMYTFYTLVLPYSRKYWQEINLAVEPKIAIVRILVDLHVNLAVWYGSPYVYMQVGNFGGF